MSSKRFVLITLLTILFFNLSRLVGWYFFGYTTWWRSTITDRWHHYQLGFLLIAIAFVVLKKRPFMKDLFLAVGSGMVIDESMYLLYPLNPAFSHYHPLGIFFEFAVFAVFAPIIFRIRSES